MTRERVAFFFTLFVAISLVSAVTTIRVIEVAKESRAVGSSKQ